MAMAAAGLTASFVPQLGLKSTPGKAPEKLTPLTKVQLLDEIVRFHTIYSPSPSSPVPPERIVGIETMKYLAEQWDKLPFLNVYVLGRANFIDADAPGGFLGNSISRTHLLIIETKADGLVIIDLASKFGTNVAVEGRGAPVFVHSTPTEPGMFLLHPGRKATISVPQVEDGGVSSETVFAKLEAPQKGQSLVESQFIRNLGKHLCGILNPGLSETVMVTLGMKDALHQALRDDGSEA